MFWTLRPIEKHRVGNQWPILWFSFCCFPICGGSWLSLFLQPVVILWNLYISARSSSILALSLKILSVLAKMRECTQPWGQALLWCRARGCRLWDSCCHCHEFLMNHHQLFVCLHWKWNFSSVLMVFCFVHFSIAGWNHMPYIATTTVQSQWVYFRMTQITKTHKIHEEEFKTPPLIMASCMAWRKNYEIKLFLNCWGWRHYGHLQNSSSESGVRGRVSFIPQSWSTVFRWGVKIQSTKYKTKNTEYKMQNKK